MPGTDKHGRPEIVPGAWFLSKSIGLPLISAPVRTPDEVEQGRRRRDEVTRGIRARHRAQHPATEAGEDPPAEQD